MLISISPHVFFSAFVVKGLKSNRKDKRTYKIVDDDVFILDETDIMMYLPQPKLVENFYIFPAEFNILNLKSFLVSVKHPKIVFLLMS